MNATKMKAKSHGTKAAFLTSLMSLILCFTMLVGTTLAWFTDTVTSGENQIIAGNLDVDVEYFTGDEASVNTDDANWKSISGEKSLFDTELWEPGATEVVYLRVVNKGTLALNWYVEVDPISETGGINQAGNSFKLSDYLVFGTTATAITPEPFADRAAARAALSTTAKGLNADKQNTFKHEGTTLKAKEMQYFALVVYMPETVGNEANYKTDTTPPQITLGVNAYATQDDYESDSFGSDYDANLTFDADDLTTTYNYFPQISMAGQVKVLAIGDSAVVDKDTAGNEVAVSSNLVTVYSDTDNDHSDATASVSIAVTPVTDAAVGDTGTVTLNVKKDDTANANFKVEEKEGAGASDTRETTTYEVSAKVTGQVKAVDGALYTVTMNIGAGKENVKLYHDGTQMTDDGTNLTETADHFVYNKTTGVVTMKVSSFSPFTATYDKPVCAIGTTAYYTLAAAIEAAKSGNTITLIKDCETGDYYGIPKEANDARKSGANPIVLDDANVTLDLNGKTITVTHNFSFVIAGNKDTVKNGTIKAGEKRGDSNEYYRGYPLVVAATQDDGSVTGVKVENVTIYGGISAGGSIENNYTDIQGAGNVTLTNCTIQSGYSYALYAQLNSTLNVVSGTYSAGKDGLAYAESGSTINIQGGTFTGKHVSSVAGTLSITGGTFSVDPSAYCANGYAAVKSGDVWTIKEYWGAHAATSFTTVDDNAKTLTINTAAELALFANNIETYKAYTVTLGADIDLTGYLWTPISDFTGTFDGASHTISNMTVQGTDNLGLFGSTSKATIKDLTVDKATITGGGTNVGVVVADAGTSTLTGVTVTNSTVNTTSKYAGGLVGNSSSTITSCSVSNSSITGKDQVGGLVGFQWCNGIWECTATNNTVTATEERAGGLVGKLQCSDGNDSYFELNNNTVTGGSATAPDYAGGLVAQIHGDTDKYEVTGNSISNITLSAKETGTIGVFRPTSEGSITETFTNAAAKNVTGNTYNGASFNSITTPTTP